MKKQKCINYDFCGEWIMKPKTNQVYHSKLCSRLAGYLYFEKGRLKLTEAGQKLLNKINK